MIYPVSVNFDQELKTCCHLYSLPFCCISSWHLSGVSHLCRAPFPVPLAIQECGMDLGSLLESSYTCRHGESDKQSSDGLLCQLLCENTISCTWSVKVCVFSWKLLLFWEVFVWDLWVIPPWFCWRCYFSSLLFILFVVFNWLPGREKEESVIYYNILRFLSFKT